MSTFVPFVISRVKRYDVEPLVISDDVPLPIVHPDNGPRVVRIGQRPDVGADSTIRSIAVEATGNVGVRSHLRNTGR